MGSIDEWTVVKVDFNYTSFGKICYEGIRYNGAFLLFDLMLYLGTLIFIRFPNIFIMINLKNIILENCFSN